MILISHRGNVNSINVERENTQEYIDEAISAGYHVEIDVRCFEDKLWLGHDTPDVIVEKMWLIERADKLFIHAKNYDALEFFLYRTNIPVFYHTVESHVLIGNTSLIWSHQLEEAASKSIIPLLSKEDFKRKDEFKYVHGICSDFVGELT